MKVLVTGAAGRLGSHVVRELHEAGHEVIATDIAYSRELAVPVRVVDLLDRTAIYPLIEGCDGVAQLGNHPNPHTRRPSSVTFAENCAMNVNVFEAAVEVGITKIAFASSIQACCGGRTGPALDQPSPLAHLPLDGNLPGMASNPYGASKVAAEALLASYCRTNSELSGTAVRFPALSRTEHCAYYREVAPGTVRVLRGEEDPEEPTAGRRRRRWWLHHMSLDECFTYLFVEDAASLVRLILERQTPGYHCYLPSMPDNTIGLAADELRELAFSDVPLSRPLGDAGTLADIKTIEAELGWTPQQLPVWDPQRIAEEEGASAAAY